MKKVMTICAGCKKEKLRNSNNLKNRSGLCRSCSAKKRTKDEKWLENIKIKNTKHGFRYKGIYSSWSQMKNRVNNINATQYSDWGGRGITYDPKRETFEGFYEDMGPTREEGLTIERIDNNGNYCKENCEWIPRKEQSKNRRGLHFITYNGDTKTLNERARFVGIKRTTLRNRINVFKRSIEKALFYKKH